VSHQTANDTFQFSLIPTIMFNHVENNRASSKGNCKYGDFQAVANISENFRNIYGNIIVADNV